MQKLLTIMLGTFIIAASAYAQVRFVDSAQSLGITQLDFGIGVAIADINGDGFAEIVSTNVTGPDRVFVWNGESYEDLGQQYGIHDDNLHHSIALVDLDKNALPDLYITGDLYTIHGHMYINIGNNHFVDMAEGYNLREVDEMGSSFFQLTQDSELSVLRGSELMIRYQGSFVDFTEGSGLEDVSNVLTPLIFDIDGDYICDLYIGHNWESTVGTLYRNNNDSTFTDISTNTDSAGFKPCNSAVIGDIDNDGDFDIYQLSGFGINSMWRNDGTGYFTDFTIASQTGYDGYTRAANFADFDNDGDLDLFVNRAEDYNMLLINDGHGVFTDISYTAGVYDSLNGFGSSVGDLNNDGQLDIVTVNCCNNLRQVYINQNQNFAYLRVKLHGQHRNTMALGTIAKLYGIDSVQNEISLGTRVLQSHTTGCSVDEPILHFGTGIYQLLRLELHWPSGGTTSMSGIVPGQTLDVYEPGYDAISDDIPNLPENSFIIQAYPNPFNSSTLITVGRGTGDCEIAIYDLLGREVKSAAVQLQSSSNTSYLWDGTDSQDNHVPSGVYFVKANSDNHSAELKVTLLK
jgi:enediyne biosynthesis protein E4